MKLANLEHRLGVLLAKLPEQNDHAIGAAGERLKLAILKEIERRKANPITTEHAPLDLSTVRGTDSITAMLVAQVKDAARAQT
jgi:hypothetical protein